MREAATETGVGLGEHLRGLKTLGFADDDVANVSGDHCRLPPAIDVIVAAGLEGFHKSALAAVAESDDWERGVFGIGVDDFRDFQRAHFAHVGGAHYGGWHVVLEGGQRECGLCAGKDFKAFAFQGVAQALGEIDIAVDQQNFCYAAWFDHESASCCCRASVGAGRIAGLGPGVNALRLRTSMTSPSCESQPETCGRSASLAGIISAKMSSQSPVTGRAIHSVPLV